MTYCKNCSERGVAGLGADLAVQPRHGLNVVVEDVRLRVYDDLNVGFVPQEVRRQHFDNRVREQLPQPVDRLREVVRAAVGKLVAVDAGDDGVL